jgi:hypothetical protein
MANIVVLDSRIFIFARVFDLFGSSTRTEEFVVGGGSRSVVAGSLGRKVVERRDKHGTNASFKSENTSCSGSGTISYAFTKMLD